MSPTLLQMFLEDIIFIQNSNLVMACIFYMFVTRSYGTPFMDSLTYEQKEIKKQSAKQR